MLRITILFMLLQISFNGFTQQGPPSSMMMERPSPEEKAKFETKKMTKKMALTDEQNKKFYAITLKYAIKADELFNAMPKGQFPPSEETRNIMRKGFKEINDNSNSEMKLILNETQFVQYQEFKKEEMSRFGPRN
jgi:hypothetical protein